MTDSSANRRSTPDDSLLPDGAWSSLWIDWLALLRGHTSFASALIELSLWTGCGVMIGTLARTVRGTPVALAVAALCAVAFFFRAVWSSVTIADELRQPLWWLGPDGLRIRLCAWIVTASWRAVIAIAAMIAIGAAGLGVRPLVVAALPLALVMACLLQAIGLAAHALVPAPLDVSGPRLVAKIVALTVLGAGAVALASLAPFCLALLHVPNVALLGTLAGVAVAMLLTAALVELTARRFGGNGSRFGLLADR